MEIYQPKEPFDKSKWYILNIYLVRNQSDITYIIFSTIYFNAEKNLGSTKFHSFYYLLLNNAEQRHIYLLLRHPIDNINIL